MGDAAIGDPVVTYKIVPENLDKAKEGIVHRNMLLNCDKLLEKFRWDLNDNDKDKKAGKERQTPTTTEQVTITEKSATQITVNKRVLIVKLNGYSSYHTRCSIMFDGHIARDVLLL